MKRLWLLVVVAMVVLGCQDGKKETASKKGEAQEESGRHAPPTVEEAPHAKEAPPADPSREPATEAPGVAPEGAPTVEEAPPAAAAKPAPRDARTYLAEMSKWLPTETVLFFFADLGALDPAELSMGLFTIPTSFDPGPMTEELGAFLEKRIGLNLMKIEWMAGAGASEPEFFVLFLGGDFGELTGAEDLPGGLKARAVDGENAWLVTIPGAKGLAVIPDKVSLEILSAMLQGEHATFPGTPGIALMETLLERSGDPRGFVVVSQLTNKDLRDKLFSGITGTLPGFVPPDGALVGAGKDILLLIHGEDASLGMIEGQLTLAKSMAKAMIDQGMAGIDRMDIPQGAGLIAAKHLWPLLSEQLTPKRDKEFMWLQLEIPGGLGMVSVVGVLAAVAVPAFIKYLQKAKAAEAHDVLHQLYRGASAYYVDEHASPDGTVFTCQMPPATGPVPRAGTCCGALGGPEGSEEGRCEGTEAEWDAAFGALGVPWPGPHFFTYEMTTDPTADEPTLIIRASADLDCDGVRSLFEKRLVGRDVPGGGCELTDSRGLLYIERETE